MKKLFIISACIFLASCSKEVASSNYQHETKATPIAGGVLLKTKWHQGYPFNKYTPYENGRQCPAGCVAIACAQIMQYCKKPADPVFNGVSCSWNTMETVCNSNDIYSNNATSEAKEQVASFLIHIGKKSLCYIRYHADGSGGYADGVVRTLKHYGYSSVRKTTGFGSKNQGKASEMLRKGFPVYLNGSDYHNGGGHAWVIDGEWNGMEWTFPLQLGMEREMGRVLRQAQLLSDKQQGIS